MRWTSWTKKTRYVLVCALLICLAPLMAPAWQITEQEPQSTAPQPQPQPETPVQPAPQETETPKPSPPEFLVIIDPSHGGDDHGAILGGQLMEKDITLNFARLLRWELGNRGIAARLLRESDVSMGPERRAELANSLHAALYIALHAGEQGEGVRVYAPLLPSSPPSGRFLPWEAAQSDSLPRSRAMASAVAAELTKAQVEVASMNAPLRPLNNIVAPAIAIELAATDEPRTIATPKFQTSVALAITTAIVKSRGQGGQP
ncbi:MAG TPA: N-acetylmuramoyl-L-alanine amidase [Candidatus Angelobacter sp.]|nr:N-acetylmuramoyl-L-alanine amidase [Candidatus Angelobacter sp.]